MARSHSRIVQYPFTASLQGALLDSFHEEQSAERSDMALHVRALALSASELVESDGVVREHVQGTYIPAQVRFTGVSERKGGEFFQNLTNLPVEDQPASSMICSPGGGLNGGMFSSFSS
ncbi:MAG TPA: hypothetical protein VFS61_04810, partial [Anaerolineales bacterium]|nr:hypothetical protein [Anaerolineales bacterium]